MMKCEAQVSFAGQVSMRRGEVRELNRSLAAPLIKCGYLKEKRERKTVNAKESKRTDG